MICRKLVFACALAVAGIVHARKLAIDRKPVSPFADTEVSTNITINASNISCENLKLQFQGTPTNDLELAFGTDANTKNAP